MSTDGYEVTLSETVVFQELQHEAVLLDLKAETYFGLDAVGTLLWRELQGSPDLRAAQDAVHAIYTVAPEQLTQDVLRFVAHLASRGLVTVRPPLPESLTAPSDPQAMT